MYLFESVCLSSIKETTEIIIHMTHLMFMANGKPTNMFPTMASIDTIRDTIITNLKILLFNKLFEVMLYLIQ